MIHKETVALLGASDRWGSFIIRGICTDYNLLLIDEDCDQLDSLKADILSLYSQANVEILNCSKDASWQADIIIVGSAAANDINTIIEIKDVAIRKPVFQINSSDVTDINLQKLFPFSKVIGLSFDIGEPALQKNPYQNINVSIDGGDEQALQTAVNIMKIIGVNPSIKEHEIIEL